MEELIGQLFSTLMDREIREGKLEYIECAREKAEELEYHFENEYPTKLLLTQHPSEEPWMKEYRKRRWQAPTTTNSIGLVGKPGWLSIGLRCV